MTCRSWPGRRSINRYRLIKALSVLIKALSVLIKALSVPDRARRSRARKCCFTTMSDGAFTKTLSQKRFHKKAFTKGVLLPDALDIRVCLHTE